MSGVYNWIKKVASTEDFKAIYRFLATSVICGLLINFSLFVTLNLTFNYYSWLGWGIAYWLLENKLISLIRRIFVK